MTKEVSGTSDTGGIDGAQMGNSFEWKADVSRRPSETEIDLEENAMILRAISFPTLYLNTFCSKY